MNVLEEAIIFATEAHQGQTRKISNIPYILHPLEVASIISTLTSDIDVMAAGVLHDTIEDCGVDPKVITEKFGRKISAIVQSETEDKMSDRPESETWMERKKDSLLMLQNTINKNVKILWISDKLSNVRSFYREYLKHGLSMWNAFNQKDPKMQKWYYETILDFTMEFKDTAAYMELKDLVTKLFKEVK